MPWELTRDIIPQFSKNDWFKMNTLLAIALSGAMGAVARYVIAGWVYQLLGRGFPWGTLLVNVSGSFLMGLLFFLFTERLLIPSELRSGILVGFLGAYTTFSTFSLETLNLVEEGALVTALGNVLASVLGCLVAVWLGMWLSRQW